MKKYSSLIVKVKARFQVTIPPRIREAFDLSVGDFLEIKKNGAAIVIKPKTLLDAQTVKRLRSESKKHGNEERA